MLFLCLSVVVAVVAVVVHVVIDVVIDVKDDFVVVAAAAAAVVVVVVVVVSLWFMVVIVHHMHPACTTSLIEIRRFLGDRRLPSESSDSISSRDGADSNGGDATGITPVRAAMGRQSQQP